MGSNHKSDIDEEEKAGEGVSVSPLCTDEPPHSRTMSSVIGSWPDWLSAGEMRHSL